MNKLKLILLVVGIIGLQSCAGNSSSSSNSAKTTRLVASLKSHPDGSSETTKTTSNHVVQVGEKLQYSYQSNASIGEATNYYISDDNVITFLEESFKSDCVEGMVGCGGTGTINFKAVKEGTTTITIENHFRSNFIAQHKFIVTVE